jgi:hypothetical protein
MPDEERKDQNRPIHYCAASISYGRPQFVSSPRADFTATTYSPTGNSPPDSLLELLDRNRSIVIAIVECRISSFCTMMLVPISSSHVL